MVSEHQRSWDEISVNQRLSVPYLTRFNSTLEKWLVRLAVVLVALFCIVVSAEVLGRNVFSFSIRWADEVSRLAFVWTVFLGAAVGFRRNDHLVIDLIKFKSGGMKDFIHSIVLQVLMLVVLGFYTYLGFVVSNSGLVRDFLTIPVPMIAGWIAIPVMGLIGSLFIFETLIRAFMARSGATPLATETNQNEEEIRDR